jgi:glycerate kinase
MQKFVLAPDSFKGTMSSREICEIMERAIHTVLPDAEVVALPVADGGEGSVEAFLAAAGGRRISRQVTGPDGDAVSGFFGLLPDSTAVIEMAAAAGLPLTNLKNPALTTTYGVGELIRAALDAGAKRMLLCLGGSATNDGGCGAAAACGVRFWNAGGESFTPVGGTLREIARIDPSGLDSRLRDVPVTVMCDIDNPLCGPQGAAAVFAPQKGADPDMVRQLDAGLAHLAALLHRDLRQDVENLPGAGAAGGMGAGAAAFFGGSLQSGVETVLDTVQFDRRLAGCDLVLTGEGRLDGQSLRGKTVAGIARRAKRCGVPVAAIVGDIGEELDAVYDMGVTGIFSINRTAVPYEQARLRAAEDLRLTVENLLRWTAAMGR